MVYSDKLCFMVVGVTSLDVHSLVHFWEYVDMNKDGNELRTQYW